MYLSLNNSIAHDESSFLNDKTLLSFSANTTIRIVITQQDYMIIPRTATDAVVIRPIIATTPLEVSDIVPTSLLTSWAIGSGSGGVYGTQLLGSIPEASAIHSLSYTHDADEHIIGE